MIRLACTGVPHIHVFVDFYSWEKLDISLIDVSLIIELATSKSLNFPTVHYKPGEELRGFTVAEVSGNLGKRGSWSVKFNKC